MSKVAFVFRQVRNNLGVLEYRCHTLYRILGILAVQLLAYIHNASANAFFCIVEYIIEECIKMFAEQLAQTIVRHSLMQQCLFNIKRTCMVRNDNGYLPCTL